MATMTSFFALDNPGPSDPESAAMDMALAYHLLRDRQYKLGWEMLAQAMHKLEPQSLSQVLRSVYSDAFEKMVNVETPFTAWLDKPTQRGGHH